MDEQQFDIIKNANAGNGPNTTYRRSSNRPFCIRLASDYMRDSKGRVRRFESHAAAERAAIAAQQATA